MYLCVKEEIKISERETRKEKGKKETEREIKIRICRTNSQMEVISQ